ncbi:MAG: Acetyl coenzyme A synthetase (ADP forming), alpha domain protein [candidate division WS6 bacterium GW2011_WS6_36_26]|uniref:Acetyl coenzyme A synthetase (ADP forming), alpha domain protein n=1 Tax=candidate division WS6 bacterium GW2011_GWF1_36_8 TaxID=1619098 RepID=A0A0G0FT85_9BACT|nr:MAG: Acetyl coenzyme A synthetase (ADP forming), alpha domain protein [candidate division WS6 bacterium GW2011_WS6_36_26]KKQ17045.1 MAG: Acetyl coenzyme A synthetase (ADP forming), alpha domain protein [candidate division WS6 bacterium GW2011_GWF1_36_8]
MENTIFSPKSIAIVGASQDSEKIASVILKNLIEDGYNGKIYPINPKYTEIQGREAYPDISAIKENIDLVCIAIPYQFVDTIIDQCIDKKVKSVVIITAGFKETGDEGKLLEEKMTTKLKDAKIRLLGPNCLGFINNKAKINLSFARENPGDGNIAFVSQSGAFCTAILDMACETGIGFSHIISLGNKADIQENELMQTLLFDNTVKALALYLEEFSDGKEFISLAQKARKPILLIAPGSSDKAKQAISSHTGSLASSYDTIIAAVKKGNIILAENSEDLFKLITLINQNAIPDGRNIAIITNAGGPGILATDAVEKESLVLTEIGEKTKQKLLKVLPRESNIKDPIDILGDAKSDRYELAIETVLEERDVDSIFTILTPQLITDIEGTAQKIVDMGKLTSKPIYACFLGGKDIKAGFRILDRNNQPSFNDIQEGIHLIAKLAKFGENKEKTKTMNCDDYKTRAKHRKEILAYTEEEVIKVLPENLGIALLEEFKIDIPKEVVTGSIEEAVDFAAVTFPVAIKATAKDLAHKTDFKGIYLDIRTITEFEEKFVELRENITKITGNPAPEILVQEMIEGKVEFFIGANREGDSRIYEKDGKGFGHLLAIGQGGIYTEVYKDIKHILVPENEQKIRDLFDETKISMIINGYRGKPALAKEKILDLIYKIEKLLINYPEIISMDINPVMITEKRAVVVDAKFYVKQ